MKMKNNRVILIVSSVVCLLPMILSFVLYHDLPEQIAIHWDVSGNPDKYAPKEIAAFAMPFLFMIVNLIFRVKLVNDPKHANISKKMQAVCSWLIPILSLVSTPVVLFVAMGKNIPIGIIFPALVGLVLIITGNYLPKNKQNYTIGIKLPWTFNNVDNWNKTNRLSGYLWMLGGMLLIAGAFIANGNKFLTISLIISLFILLIVIPVFYSYWQYKKRE